MPMSPPVTNTSALQGTNRQSPTPSSRASSPVESSRDNLEIAKTNYQTALTGSSEINIEQKRAAYANALDDHIKVLENNDSKLQTELDTAARNRSIPHIDSVGTRIRANNEELTQTITARSSLSAAPTVTNTVPATVAPATTAPATVVPTRTPTPTATPTSPTTTIPTQARQESPTPGTTIPEPIPNPGPVIPSETGQVGAANLGAVLPKFSNVIDGTHGTSANAALGILEELSAGRPPFRTELGERGAVQWFVTEGNPKTGVGQADVTLPVEVDVPRGANVLEFNDASLRSIYDELLPDATNLATEQFANNNPNKQINSKGSQRKIAHNARAIAEGRMWIEVGNRVAASEDGIGRVVQTANSLFSEGQPGNFMLTSNPEVVRVKGGAATLLNVIESKGIRAEPAVVEAAEQAANSGKINGRVRGVFRVAGRVLVVAGAAADGYRIYQADDRIRETVIVGGGWAGAGAAIGTYNVATGATNAAGPVAWGINLVGNIGAGVAGYYAGEKIAEYVYDLVVDPNPIEIPAG